MERSMLGSHCGNNKNFCDHYKLSGHQEANWWRLHPEHHPRNCTTKRRVWKVKPNINKELNACPSQGEDIVQGAITTHEVCITIEENNGLMPTTKATLFW